MSDRVLPIASPLYSGGHPRMLPGLPTLVDGPVAEPLTLEEAKQHLRYGGEEDNEYIADLIAVARDQVERYTRRALYRQRWRFSLTRFPPVIRLPIPPHMAVESISYVDEGGASRTLDPSVYVADLAEGVIAPAFGQAWPWTRPQSSAVTVLWRSGYTDGIVPGSDIPQDGDPLKKIPRTFRQAMRLLVGAMYENREAIAVSPGVAAVEMPFGVSALLTPLRAWSP